MEITYLWVDKIGLHPGGGGAVGETTDMEKIVYNIGKMDEDTQKFIALHLLLADDEPVLESIFFFGRFICHVTISKAENTGKMYFFDVRIKSRTEWGKVFKKLGERELAQVLERYDAAVVLSELEFDSFELSIKVR